jgi:hypothetical protein
MTTERFTDQQLDEKARSLQKQLCNDRKVFEQLKLMLMLNRGGEVKLKYDTTGILQKVGYEQQL